MYQRVPAGGEAHTFVLVGFALSTFAKNNF
jgi:hypothetical protein